MATKDRIHTEIQLLINSRVRAWRQQRQELLDSVANVATKVAELDAMIAEAETELAVAAGKLPRG